MIYRLESPSELLEQLRKTASYLMLQVMNNQFKTPSPWGLRQLYYIYRKTYDLRLVPSLRCGFCFEAEFQL